MNSEKLRSPASTTFKNANFRSVCELEKTRRYSLRPKFQSPNFESVDELGKIVSNLSFTVENTMGNLHKTGHISNLT